VQLRTTARLLVAGAAFAAVTVTAPGLPAASAAGTELHATPAAAKPNATVVVSGKIPAQAGQPFSVEQLYTNGNVARVTKGGAGGVAGSNGEVTTTVTIPADAARSNVLRPYGSWQYDVVVFQFPPGCPAPGPCTTYGANVNVLPVSDNERIELSTLQPKTGDALAVHVTNCVGGILTEFARVIDNNGSYFPFTGAISGTTFDGSADLASGYRGKHAPTGAAHVSSPVGIRDALAALPCSQSDGPASVAAADHLEHLSMVVDITICPRTGTCRVNNNAIAPAGQPPNVDIPADATSQTSIAPAAEPAQAVTAQPTFVG
jgi:hypothetical protein